MQTRKELKFKKTRTGISFLRKKGVVYLMPDGYRLATVQEIRNNFDTIVSQGLEKKMRLLDGYISKEPAHCGEHLGCSPISPDRFIKEAFTECDWEIVVKEKKWDEIASVWKKKDSACYSPNSILLRKQLYHEIDLSLQGRQIALALASFHGDSEVMYWLLKDKDPGVFEDFKNFFRQSVPKREIHNLVLRGYSDMVKSLLASKFPLTLSPTQDNQGSPTVVDNAIKCLRLGNPNYIGILIVELFLEIYSIESIVQHKTMNDKSLLEVAIEDAENGGDTLIPIMAKLFSEYPQSLENQISKIKTRYRDVLFEAVERNYCQLVEGLLKYQNCIEKITTNACQEVARRAVNKGCLKCVKKMLDLLKDKHVNELNQDKDGKTLFHYAAESGDEEIFKLLEKTYRDEHKWGRNILHWAALNGQADFCRDCVYERQLKVNDKDIWGQNSLHMAAKGNKGHLVVDILVGSYSELIYATDDEGRTPLHHACAKGNKEMVKKLLSFIEDNQKKKKYIQQCDGVDRTALHMAAGGGHTRIVQQILNEGCDNLLQHDIDGRTALHYATQVKDAKVAVAISRLLLNKYEDGSDEKSLLLWASAPGIGTAEESKDVHPYVKHFLLQEKAIDQKNLLQAAARTNNVEMAWELLNRGANIKDIYEPKWIRKVRNVDPPDVINNVENVINQIELEKAHGPDRPSPEDNLGRNAFAEGLASLFLNKFIESPITVGICGEWGMGKTSLMTQTENILLLAASQLAFPNLLRFEKFVGAEKISLNPKGWNIYRKIKNGASKLLAPPEDISENQNWNPLVKLLNEYHPQYHAVYKSLACMDLDNQILRSEVDKESQFLPMRRVPRILTIRYDAWHYRDEHEAWAGLAVTITKEIEQAMTRSQKFGTCWRYSWAKNSVKICIQIFLPCLLTTFLAGLVAWASWILLKDSRLKDLQYGSIPCTIIVIVWVVLKSVISVVKPVSTEMMGYITSPDHRSRLGYQEEVISDIKFLKGELGKKPHWFFRMISGEWCWNWFGWPRDNVEKTCVPKFSPASDDQLRMITFVDNLDRCDEKVILQVLSAINLVLADCKINVILGMDKKVIERAVGKHFQGNEDRDLAEKFICKIIQIPLSLPDPTKKESEKFLEHLLGRQPPTLDGEDTDYGDQDGEDTDYGDLDTDNDVDDEENVAPRQKQQSIVDIGCCDGRPTSSKGILGKVFNWLAWVAWLAWCFVTCNLSSKDEFTDKEIRPLTFSKGARLTREMVLSNYSLEEVNTLYKLRRFATGNRKLPRDWKLILTYRKLACNILSIIGKVHKLSNWKVELVAWIFICWQWKHEMNILIKGWKKYVVLNSKEEDKFAVCEDEVGSSSKSKDKSALVEDEVGFSHKNKDKSVIGEDKVGPSLKQIVLNYLSELKKPQPFKDIQADLEEKTHAIMKLKDSSRQDPFVKAILSMYSHDSGADENWLNLLEALAVQDVTMKGIQLFQQFRLHCETDYLPWPLPESIAHKIVRLTSSKKN